MCVCVYVCANNGGCISIYKLVKQFSGKFLHHTNLHRNTFTYNTFLRLHLKLYKFEGYFTIVTILFQIITPLYLMLDCPSLVLLRGGHSK